MFIRGTLIDASEDLFVLSSLREEISNTILEAMATALPVVATNTGGNPEIVVDETGELVPHSDPVAIGHAIAGYISNRGRASDHRQKKRERVECQFSMQAMINAYVAPYDSVLRKAHRTSPVGDRGRSSRAL